MIAVLWSDVIDRQNLIEIKPSRFHKTKENPLFNKKLFLLFNIMIIFIFSTILRCNCSIWNKISNRLWFLVLSVIFNLGSLILILVKFLVQFKCVRACKHCDHWPICLLRHSSRVWFHLTFYFSNLITILSPILLF